jgi:hypothetical protein
LNFQRATASKIIKMDFLVKITIKPKKSPGKIFKDFSAKTLEIKESSHREAKSKIRIRVRGQVTDRNLQEPLSL